MRSVPIRYAKELKEFLSGKEFDSETLIAEMKLVPEKEIPLQKSLTAIIVPAGLSSRIERGSTRDREVSLDVGITRRADISELESLLDIVQAIGDSIEGYKFACGGVCTEVDYTLLHSVESFLQQHSFFSLLTVKIKVL